MTDISLNANKNNRSQRSDFEYLFTRLFASWLYLKLGRWEGVGEFFDIPRATAWRVGHDPEYFPKDPELCRKVNLTYYAEIPVCKIHGVAHCFDCETEQVKPKPRKSSPRQSRPKMVSLGKPTPQQEAIVMDVTPEFRLNAIISAKHQEDQTADSNPSLNEDPAEKAWSLPFEELEDRFRMVTGGLK